MDVGLGGGGTVSVIRTIPSSYPFTYNFDEGMSVRLEAVPAPGYIFNNWSGDLNSTTSPTAIVIDCNKSITANFSRIMHTLTMQISGSGSTTPTVGTHDYGEGEVVSITATPESGWQFDSWSGDVADPGLATTTVTMASYRTLTANFSQAKTGWWLFGGIVTGAIIIGLIIWLAVSQNVTSTPNGIRALLL